MSKEIKDMAVWVRTRLLAISKSRGKPFDQIMTLYMLERLWGDKTMGGLFGKIRKGMQYICYIEKSEDDSCTTRVTIVAILGSAGIIV